MSGKNHPSRLVAARYSKEQVSKWHCPEGGQPSATVADEFPEVTRCGAEELVYSSARQPGAMALVVETV